MEINLLEKNNQNNKVKIGDIIVTRYFGDGESRLNYYLVIGIQNCHGAVTEQTLLYLNYNEIISTDYTDIEKDILEDFLDFFGAGEEEFVKIIPKEDLILTLKDKSINYNED